MMRLNKCASSRESEREVDCTLDAQPVKAAGEDRLRGPWVVVAAAAPFPNADVMRFAMLAPDGATVVKGV